MNAGKEWKEERESRGLTLDDAASALRIGRKYLQDMEEGEYAGWPSRVYSAGYIRAYAKFLSRSPETVLSEYFHFLEKNAVIEPPAGYSIPAWVEKERRRGSRRTNYAIAAVVVLLAGVLLSWFGARISSRRIPASPPAAVLPPAPPRQENAAATTGPESPDNAAQTAPADRPLAPETSAPAPQGTVSSVGGSGRMNSPYQLLLEASEMTWVMYGIDDEEPVDVMLYPRDRISMQARKKIFLKLGNAGGVVGTLNGRLLSPFGDRGQVKEIRFGE